MEDLAFMLRSAIPIDDIDQLMMSPTERYLPDNEIIGISTRSF